MKYKNVKKKYQSLDLQLFSEGDGESGTDGDDSGEGDDPDDDESDENGEEDKKFSQKDLDEAIKKRLAREKKKWQNEQKKKADNEENPENKEDKEKQEAISKASQLEVKVACFEADVAKDAVDDVAALAHAYMAADEDLDLEEAIEKVVKKYPQFKKSTQDPYEEKEPRKAWGERQKGTSKKTSGVEAAFLKKNPGLKID